MRRWLKDFRHEGLSVCEVILVDEKFAHLGEDMGVARAFHFHVQVEWWLELGGTCYRVRDCLQKAGTKLPPKSERYTWLDYFSLRQAAPSDFEPHAIVRLVREIGVLTVGTDSKMEYSERSFCLMEFFAAHAGGAEIILEIGATKEHALEDMKPGGRVGPIDSAAAQTRKPEDKRLIDGFILAEFGADGFRGSDRAITELLLSQLR